MLNQTGLDLMNRVKPIVEKPAEYFMNDDYYCESVGCEKDYCEDHNGSVLSATHHISDTGIYEGCTVVVGTGGPHLQLDTRSRQVEGFWSGERWSDTYDILESEKVDEYWKEMFSQLMESTHALRR